MNALMKVSRSLATGVVLSLNVLSVSAASVQEGLVFDLGGINPTADGTPAVQADIVDLTKWADATGRVVPASDGLAVFSQSRNDTSEPWMADIDGSGVKQVACKLVPQALTVTNVAVVTPMRQWETNVQTCLYFPQQVHDCGNAVTGVYACVIKTAKPILTGPNVTYHFRFWWEGGLGLTTTCRYFQCYDKLTGKSVLQLASDGGYLRLDINGQGKTFYNMLFRPRRWIDVIACCADNGSGGSNVKVYMVCQDDAYAAAPLMNTDTMSISTQAVYSKDASGNSDGYLTIGQDSIWWNNVGYYRFRWYPLNSSSPAQWCFRGYVSRLRIYDRELSEPEMMAILENAAGTEFSVGAVNGSEQEFAPADDADLAETFEPLSMPARRMRGELSAGHPSLTLKFPLPESAEKLTRILSVRTLLADPAGKADLLLSKDGELVFRAPAVANGECALYLPKRKMVRDADGNVTLTLSLADGATTSVRIDALSLVGSWTVGPDAFREWKTLSHDAEKFWNGRICSAYCGSRSVFYQDLFGLCRDKPEDPPDRPETTVSFEVPAAVAANETSTFEIDVSSVWFPNFTKIDVYLNGEIYHHFLPPVNAPTTLTLTFAPGVLQAGLNSLKIVSAGDTFPDGDYGTLVYDKFTLGGYRFTVKNHGLPTGLLMYFR